MSEAPQGDSGFCRYSCPRPVEGADSNFLSAIPDLYPPTRVVEDGSGWYCIFRDKTVSHSDSRRINKMERKGIEDNFGCDPEEADASTADKAEKDQQPEEPADDSLSPMMEDDEISENDELTETDGEPGDAEKETSDEDFMGEDREVADDVTDEIGYKTFLADVRSFADHCSSFKERIANALRKTGLKLLPFPTVIERVGRSVGLGRKY